MRTYLRIFQQEAAVAEAAAAAPVRGLSSIMVEAQALERLNGKAAAQANRGPPTKNMVWLLYVCLTASAASVVRASNCSGTPQSGCLVSDNSSACVGLHADKLACKRPELSRPNMVKTLAGGRTGAAGFLDGPGTASLFSTPRAVVLSQNFGFALVVDYYNRTTLPHPCRRCPCLGL